MALTNNGRLVARLEHEQPNSHAELLLPLIEQLLAEAGWQKSSLDRLGVGTGPGSFTGLRAGIALAEGLSVGLDRPLVGVSSLLAMAHGASSEHAGPCCALLDARRQELFAGVYGTGGAVLQAPLTVPIDDLRSFLERFAVETVVGEVALTLPHGRVLATGPELDLPHARWVATLAEHLDEAAFPPEPEYVRGIGATLPKLPRDPLATQ